MKAQYKVNILTPHEKSMFIHQLPNDFRDVDFYENGPLDQEYNLVVIYEGVKSVISVKCDPRNILFISGEPPMSRVYTKGFLSQFSFVFSSHVGLKHPRNMQVQQCLPWHFGFDFLKWQFRYSYDDLIELPRPKKTKKISIVVSNKLMMPGHRNRVSFVKALMKRFGDSIDFYGKGINPINDKADAISPYYMTICIENSSLNNYWTEKLADAFLGYSLPIYHGCTNIGCYFPEGSMYNIDINNIDVAIRNIEYLLENCEQIYASALPDIEKARHLLMSKYNIFPTLADFVNDNNLLVNSDCQDVTIVPNHCFGDFKREMMLLKLRRYLKK